MRKPPDERQDINALAIRDNAIRRLLTLLALKPTARFYKCDGPCVPISIKIIVKTGKSVGLTEATTMAFIAARTNVLVPCVHCSFIHNNATSTGCSDLTPCS